MDMNFAPNGLAVMGSAIEITNKEFDDMRGLVYRLAGIHLNDSKKMLVVSRLSKRLRTLGFQSFGQYYTYLQDPNVAKDELVTFINQITTNKTDFFRENHHFEMLKTRILPARYARVNSGKQSNLRIWSAGCSTGEEPYTISMVLSRFLSDKKHIDAKILATDLDTGVLAQAKDGVYRADRIQDIAPEIIHSSFLARENGDYEIRPELRALVHFGRFNLMHAFPFRAGFDIIFCRNVLIYFNNPDRKAIVQKFKSVLRPGGWLLLGHSESLVADGLGFESRGLTMYNLPEVG